ncbi:MAG: alpha-amylase family glycosyl hydrolase [Kovacikia sp.]
MLKQFRAVLSTCIAFAIACAASPTKADVIYQAFDERFQDIKTKLPDLQNLGYTYIQVSPPAQSNPATDWWGRYQPIDYTVLDSPLGNEQDLKALIDEAHRKNIKVIVDVVLNQMSNYGNYGRTLQYPRFSRSDFHAQQCIDYDNRWSVIHGWINCDLPDLNTTSPYVRQEAKTYLKKLLSLGADGFRFDAAKHIEPDFFRDIKQVIPADKFIYGEVIGRNIQESYDYTGIFSVTDFHLVGAMINAFSYGGDLRSLINPAGQQQALPGTSAVTFARNHDIDKGQIGYIFPSYQDAMLASAYVLAREEGFPIIYGTDAYNPITKAGVLFHEKMMGQPQYFRNGNEVAERADNPNTLFIERGNQGLAIINKANTFFDVAVAKMPGLAVGCYQELHYNFTVGIGTGGDGQKYINHWGTPQRGGIQIGPRDALFLIPTAPQKCSP